MQHLALGEEKREIRGDGDTKFRIEIAFRNDETPTHVTGIAGLRVGEELPSHRRLRGPFLPDAQPRYAGYVCWRFVVPECDLDPEFRIAIAPDFSFFLAEGQMLHGFLIPGLDDEASAGQRAYCVVWYRR